ncbi:hypothetical protein FOMA001_g5026 [Fusarium oxysporum f. sp. matthiolae]|nr:hypothetical protein FOMA001_g5026 [Fusarium oxysporum f. sp. matthiolae]
MENIVNSFSAVDIATYSRLIMLSCAICLMTPYGEWQHANIPQERPISLCLPLNLLGEGLGKVNSASARSVRIPVYIAAANTGGIFGGKDIPAVCTNWGIYQYADFLLDPTNPNFVASKGAGGDNSPDAWDRLNKAKERLVILRSELDDAKKQAMQDFKDDDNPDKPKSFAQWASLNANAHLVAFQNWEAAASEVQMKTDAIGGAGSVLLAEAMKSAANGSNTLTEQKAYNMKASIQSVTYDAAGKPILPDPLETQYVPQYSISGYAAMLDGWVGFSNKKPDEFGIGLSAGQ